MTSGLPETMVQATGTPGRPASGMQVVLDARVVSNSGGGPDKTILNSPRFLARDGYRNICAYMHPPEDPGFETLRRRAEALRATLLSIPDRGPRDWRVVTQMLAICRRERVAIWHGHDYKSNALGLLLRPFWPMRLVTTVHGWGVAGARPLYNRIDRLCLPYYERVICVSQDLLEQCLACGVRPERCVLIENAVDTEQFARRLDTAEAKARLGILPTRQVVGAVGRLSGEKGFDLLIRATDRLLREGIDVELRIIGEGDQRPQLDALVSELGLEDRVHLPGYRSDASELYQAMDAYALSSISEGLPNVLLEAMALEVPVVATRVGGVPGLVRHEENGLLVEPGSVEALAEALGRILRVAELSDRLRRAGRATIEASYSFDVRMRKIRDLYDELLGRAEAPDPHREPQA